MREGGRGREIGSEEERREGGGEEGGGREDPGCDSIWGNSYNAQSQHPYETLWLNPSSS